MRDNITDPQKKKFFEEFSLILLVVASHLSQYSLPVLLGAAADTLKLTNSQAGLLPAAELAWFTVGAAAVSMIWQKFSKPTTILTTVFILATLQIISGFAETFSSLLVLRSAVGLDTGILVAVAYGLIAQQERYESLYARAIFYSVLASALVLFIGPSISDALGHMGAYGFVGLMILASVPIMRSIPLTKTPRRQHAQSATHSTSSLLTLCLFFLAVLLFSTSNVTVYMYAERIGRDLNIESSLLGLALGLSYIVGLAGAWWADKMGTNHGYLTPLVIASIGIGLTAIGMTNTTSQIIFFASAALLNVFVFMIVPYALGLGALLDCSGRVSAALGALLPLGGALGSMSGGYLADLFGFPMLGWSAMAMAIVAAASFLLPSRAGQQLLALENAPIFPLENAPTQ